MWVNKCNKYVNKLFKGIVFIQMNDYSPLDSQQCRLYRQKQFLIVCEQNDFKTFNMKNKLRVFAAEYIVSRACIGWQKFILHPLTH